MLKLSGGDAIFFHLKKIYILLRLNRPSMRNILLCLLAFPALSSYGQFALVADKDGYSNIRKEGQSGAPIIDTLHNGHLVYCWETKDGWTNIYYLKKTSTEIPGYIHRDRLKLISDYEKIPAVGKDYSVFRKDSIVVTQSIKPFVIAQYRVTYTKGEYRGIAAINGKAWWGTDGELPKKAYKSIQIRLGGREMDLPKEAIADVFEPTPWNMEVNYDRAHDILYIQAMNSDGAGAYSVIWTVEKGEYKGRWISGTD